MTLKEQAEALGIKVDGRWGDDRIQKEIDKVEADIDSSDEIVIHTSEVFESNAMNDLALRIWEGQSISLPLKERAVRIAKALRNKGYEDLSGLKLPEDVSRYIG